MVDIFEAESIEQLLAHPFSELYCDPAERNIFIDKVKSQGHVNGGEVRLKTLRGREFDAALTAVAWNLNWTYCLDLFDWWMPNPAYWLAIDLNVKPIMNQFQALYQ